MLVHLSVKNFQSLRSADLELGRFTVVIGPSNSGKSALLRAIHMVAHNVTSPKDVVAHGATEASSTVHVNGDPNADPAAITIVRGKSRSVYSIDDEQYPKSGVAVPEDVSKILSFAEIEGEDLNFAFQFDRPFLLDVPATTAAKVLGDLTNVNRIFAAVREANRRLLEKRSRLKVRREQHEALLVEVQQYVGLPKEIEAAAAARKALNRAEQLDAKVGRLHALLNVADTAGLVLTQLRNTEIPEVPDLATMVEKLRKARAITGLAVSAETHGREISIATEDVAKIEQAISNADAEFHSMLKGAGTCPLCGAKTKK